MNWESIGPFAEVVSAFAVVISLAILGYEIHQNRKTVESAAVDALAAGFNSWNEQLISDEKFFESFFLILARPEDASELEKTRFLWMFQSLVNHLNTVKKYHETGALPQEEWDIYIEGVTQLFNTPGGEWALENIATTPTLLSAIRKSQGTLMNDGILGLQNTVDK
jgi:hypothetical protein